MIHDIICQKGKGCTFVEFNVVCRTIFISDLDGVIVTEWDYQKAAEWVKKRKGYWISPNLIQSRVKIRCKHGFRHPIYPEIVLTYDSFWPVYPGWKADETERTRVEKINKRVMKCSFPGTFGFQGWVDQSIFIVSKMKKEPYFIGDDTDLIKGYIENGVKIMDLFDVLKLLKNDKLTLKF